MGQFGRGGHVDQLGDHRQNLLGFSCARERTWRYRLLIRVAGSQKCQEVNVGVDEAGCDDVAGGVDPAQRSPRIENVSFVANGDDETGTDGDRCVVVDASLGS